MFPDGRETRANVRHSSKNCKITSLPHGRSTQSTNYTMEFIPSDSEGNLALGVPACRRVASMALLFQSRKVHALLIVINIAQSHSLHVSKKHWSACS